METNRLLLDRHWHPQTGPERSAALSGGIFGVAVYLLSMLLARYSVHLARACWFLLLLHRPISDRLVGGRPAETVPET